MRTLIIIVSGLVLLALCLGAASLFKRGSKVPITQAVWVFIGLWLVVAGGNMWVGVSQAGYGVMEEFPIFLLIFGAPALVALAFKWKFG